MSAWRWLAGAVGVLALAPLGRAQTYTLAEKPAAGECFDSLAQYYRRAYLRYIDATTRRPEVRAARITEVVDLLAAGVKERPQA